MNYIKAKLAISQFFFKDLSFSNRTTHICVVIGKVGVAKVHNFCAVGHLNVASVSACAHCLWNPHTPRYLFLNIVNCNVHTFFVAICLMCVQVSPLLHLTKSRIFCNTLEAPKIHSPMSHFSHLSIRFECTQN
jgi:hypothetical protein